jgi:dihydroorotase
MGGRMGWEYDLLLKGGRVIDPESGIDAQMDVAVRDGRIAAVGPGLSEDARKAVEVDGFCVTPGLIDMHVHVYGLQAALWPDGYSLPNGVTTVVDAGGAGWRNFEEFKNRVISPTRGSPTKTRVLALLNIVGEGMGGFVERNVEDMDPRRAADMIGRYPEIIVGLKAAHFAGPNWESVDSALEAGRLSGTPVMFGIRPPELPSRDCANLYERMRPGDMSTHMYNWMFQILDADGTVNGAFWRARERGVLFDVGHGGASLCFRFAVPAIEQGFGPDTISTDLHSGSRLLADATMLTTMSKFLNMGLSLGEVVRRSTLTPAEAIGRSDLGSLTPGNCADVAVLEVERGEYGFVDSLHARMSGDRRLRCVMTIRAGEVVWDPEGLSWPDWRRAGEYGPIGQYDTFP